MISFYAAAIGVMFLLFTASGSAGALLDEAESGTLERVLSTRVTMTKLLAGKLVFNTLLAFVQLVAMFLWGWAVFKLDFFSHLAGFMVMGLSTAFAVAAFGMLLASVCHTRRSWERCRRFDSDHVVGGRQHVSALLMPEAMQKAGLVTINAWAIDGFTKVFWRDLPVRDLWPQVACCWRWVGAVSGGAQSGAEVGDCVTGSGVSGASRVSGVRIPHPFRRAGARGKRMGQRRLKGEGSTGGML